MTDVSVIIPVHNTAAYLPECFDSVLTQTLLRDRPGSVEVVVVDDGSTDGSQTLIDEYAEKHPDVFRVEHHPASGGPAAPRNRALALARGRYLFFLDSDDHLWEEALARLVAAADEWESDMVLGRQVGTNGRGVYQGIFAETRRDVGLLDRELPYNLSVTRLYRHSMITEHGLRFPELRIGSDQPFAASAMLAARRISVLADAPYYFVRKREDLSNISFSVPWRPRLQDLSAMIHQVAAMVPEGEVRENVLSRHFDWELTSLLQRSWPDLDRAEKAELVEGVAAMADAYLTPGVAARLTVRRRVLQRLAHARRPDLLDLLFAAEDDGTEPALVLRGDRAYVAYPGFDELPQEWFALSDDSVAWRLRRSVRVDAVAWEGPVLRLRGHLRVRPDADPPLQAVLVPVGRSKASTTDTVRLDPARATATGPVTLEADGDGSALGAQVDATPLLRSKAAPGRRWEVRLRWVVAGRTVDVAVSDVRGARTRVRLGLRFFALRARRSPQGRLTVTRKPVPLRRAVADRLGRSA